MTIRVVFDTKQMGPKLRRFVKRQGEKVRRVSRLALNDAMIEALDRARENIASAGKFGQRWTEGLRGKITEGGGTLKLTFTHEIPYWIVFQEGRVIEGKPLLWIPLSFAEDAQGVSARDYPGQLFRVDRKNGLAPLLMDAGSKEPKYFGKESVTIPKKFMVLEIITGVARNMREFFRARFRAED